eukprot:406438_1
MGIEYSEFADEKIQYNGVDEDDIAEVCVTGQDGNRLAIYETSNKDDAIVQCIGNLRIYYDGDIKGGHLIGTGTVFHVEGDNCFVLTCAHNIRLTKVYHCQKQNCDGKRLTDSKCHICGSFMVKKQQVLKAIRVTFVRWGITKKSRGDHEDEYECDMKQCIINDNEYLSYPHPTSGNDIAILIIYNNKKAANYYRDIYKNIF